MQKRMQPDSFLLFLIKTTNADEHLKELCLFFCHVLEKAAKFDNNKGRLVWAMYTVIAYRDKKVALHVSHTCLF